MLLPTAAWSPSVTVTYCVLRCSSSVVLEALWGALQLKVSNGMGLGTVHPVLKTPETVGFFFLPFWEEHILETLVFPCVMAHSRAGPKAGGWNWMTLKVPSNPTVRVSILACGTRCPARCQCCFCKSRELRQTPGFSCLFNCICFSGNEATSPTLTQP